MTRTYVLTNHKGAWFLPYKSTSATNIALGMAAVLRQAKAKNSKVLLIDTDSQAHATLVTTGRNDYGTQDSLYTVLMADRQNATQTLLNCVPSAWDEDLHVLPGSPLLEQAKRELQGTAGAPYRIADPLAKIASGYAAIVIDTRPSSTRDNEPGALTYDWHINENDNSAISIERYTDSDAAMIHINTFAEKFSERFSDVADQTRLLVYGNPDDAVRSALSGAGGTFTTPIIGFSR